MSAGRRPAGADGVGRAGPAAAAARLRRAAWAWAAAVGVSGVVPTRAAVHALAEGHDGLVTSVGHGLAYALLAVLMAGAAGWRLRRGLVLRVLLAAAALGGAVEAVQAPLTYRDCQAADLVVDLAGAVAGLILVAAVNARAGRPAAAPPEPRG